MTRMRCIGDTRRRHHGLELAADGKRLGMPTIRSRGDTHYYVSVSE